MVTYNGRHKINYDSLVLLLPPAEGRHLAN